MNPNMEAIEKIIDQIGLIATLELIADICGEKAEHLRSNWQDSVSAKMWDRESRRIATLVSKVEIQY